MLTAIQGLVIPPQLAQTPETFHRAKLALGFALLLLPMAFIFGGLYFALGAFTNGVMVAATGGLIILSLVVLRLGGLTAACQMITLSLLLVEVVDTYFNGGIAAPNVAWFLTIPALAALLSGWRNGLLWGFLSTLVVGGIYTIEVTHGVGASAIPEQWQAPMRLALLCGALLTNMGMVAMVEYYRQVSQTRADQAYANALQAQHEAEAGAQNMQSLLSGAQRNAEQLAAASEELATTTRSIEQHSETMHRRTHQQGSASEEINASLQHLAEGISRNTAQIQDINRLSQLTQSNASNGSSAVIDAVESMKDIKRNNQEINTAAEMIYGIAQQTNLLALNASIEAARAGELGRGFAVVADEVRDLASRSSSTVQEIQHSLEQATASIDQGERVVTGAGEQLGQILDDVTTITTQVDQLAAGMLQGEQGVKEMVAAVGELTESAADNLTAAGEVANSSRDIAATTDSLSEMAHELNALVIKG